MRRNPSEGEQLCDMMLCILSCMASVVFMFSAIILVSGQDHVNNGLTDDGQQMVEVGKYGMTGSFLIIFITCLKVSRNVSNYIWAYIPSLLFSTAVICAILARDGIECGRCTRVYLQTVSGELNNEALEKSNEEEQPS